MNPLRLLLIAGLIAAVPARAVYAPLPEPQDQKNLIVTLSAGATHDSNIFGSQNGAISSMVYSASPAVAFNGSLSDQTFAAFGYNLTVDHFTDRPGTKTLDSHNVNGRIAHAFGPASNIDVLESYQIARNPESLLSGVPVNSDQSFKRNQFDGKFVFSPAPKFGGALKLRNVIYRYNNDVLARGIDRMENLAGLSGSYDFLPELKFVTEYRHEDIYYRKQGETKNKHSDFALAGFDYALARKLSVTGRFGNEWRDRVSERDTTSPYAELSAKYDYAARSFIAAGYGYTFEETSNVAVYNDTQVSRFFVNVQHAVTALIVASTSITYEPSELQGRRDTLNPDGTRGTPNADETTTRLGFALTWLPNVHWSMSATFDYDHVQSDAPGRGQKRNRTGVNAAYSF